MEAARSRREGEDGRRTKFVFPAAAPHHDRSAVPQLFSGTDPPPVCAFFGTAAGEKSERGGGGIVESRVEKEGSGGLGAEGAGKAAAGCGGRLRCGGSGGGGCEAAEEARETAARLARGPRVPFTLDRDWRARDPDFAYQDLKKTHVNLATPRLRTPPVILS